VHIKSREAGEQEDTQLGDNNDLAVNEVMDDRAADESFEESQVDALIGSTYLELKEMQCFPESDDEQRLDALEALAKDTLELAAAVRRGEVVFTSEVALRGERHGDPELRSRHPAGTEAAGAESGAVMSRPITAEQMQAGRRYIGVTLYKAGKNISEVADVDGAVRKLFEAPDSAAKRHFLQFVREVTQDDLANKASEAAGLYDIYHLYSALCDLSEHIIHDQGKTEYRTPPIFMTSTEARRSASNIIGVVRRVTGFDLMDPVGSLKRMKKKVAAL
jgi:hypothetical protein